MGAYAIAWTHRYSIAPFQPGFADGGEDLAHIVVDALNHAVVLGHRVGSETVFDSVMRLAPPGQALCRLVHCRGGLERLFGVHGVVWRADGVWPVRVGNRDHVAEGLVLVGVDEVDGLVGEEVGGEVLGVGADDAVFFAVYHARALGRVFELLPMAAIEHVTVVGEAELALGCPLGPAIAVDVPLARVAGRIAGFPENLGERDRVVRQRHAVVEHAVILRVSPRDECAPAGRADRRGGVESRRNGAVVGEPVDVRRFADGRAPHQRTVHGHELAVAAQRAEIMLVGVDDQQVGPATAIMNIKPAIRQHKTTCPQSSRGLHKLTSIHCVDPYS